MSIQIGPYEFDDVFYDADAHVLYLSVGPPRPAADVHASPEGHAVRLEKDGSVIGITIVNAKWLTERDGKVTITFPDQIETTAEELAPALTGAD